MARNPAIEVEKAKARLRRATLRPRLQAIPLRTYARLHPWTSLFAALLLGIFIGSTPRARTALVEGVGAAIKRQGFFRRPATPIARPPHR
jgi:hypothetical protein